MKKLLYLIFYLLSMPVFATVSVEVLETFPEQSGQPLAVDQNFYVHIRYASDLPVRIYVRPYTEGKASNAITGASLLLPAGIHETLGWFAMREPGRVDEYGILADTENTGYPTELLRVPARLEWTPGGIVTNVGQPKWLVGLIQINSDLAKTARQKAAMETSVFDLLFGFLLMLLLFAIPILILALSAAAIIRWKGSWRLFGALPLALLSIWMVNITSDVTRDPTSHNLWPFELLYWALATLIWLALLFILRKLIDGNS